MSTSNSLISLKLVTAKKQTSIPPILNRRNKLAEKIWDQIQLAKALKDGGTYSTKRFKTVKDYDGGIKTIELQKRVRQWWFTSEQGKVCLSIRYGARLIELAKGKSAVEVGTTDDLINTLEIIRKAALTGELDTQIEQVSGAVKAAFKK